MIEGRSELLYPYLQAIIEAERKRIEALRDSNEGDLLLMARGRLEAWYAVSNYLVFHTDSLQPYREDGKQ